MNLRTLVWLAALTYTFVIGGGLLCYRLFVVYPPIAAATLEKHQNDIKAIQTTFSNEREALLRFNQDWAKWNDSYEFVARPNYNYIKLNIKSPSFLASNIDSVIFLTLQGKSSYFAEKINNQFITKNNTDDLNYDINNQLLLNQDKQFGLIRRNGKLAYFVSHHIQDSEQKLASNGVLIFIRQLTKDFIKRLNLISNVNFKLASYKHVNEPDLTPLSELTIHELSNKYSASLVNIKGQNIAQIEILYPDSSMPTPLDRTSIISILVLILLPITITLLLNHFFLLPIIGMFNQIGEMKKTGEVNLLAQKTNIVEIDGFLKTFNRLVEKINEQKEILIADSITDGLTQIYNRKYFDQTYDRVWRTTARNHNPIGIVMLDIDFFKNYNDYYGHLQGDEALKLIAKTLKQIDRRADSTLARYGGEEFVFIFQPKSTTQLENMLIKLVEAVRLLAIEHKESQTANIVTISCGACFIQQGGAWMKNNKEAALKCADDALYRAKANGRNQYYFQSFEIKDR